MAGVNRRIFWPFDGPRVQLTVHYNNFDGFPAGTYVMDGVKPKVTIEHVKYRFYMEVMRAQAPGTWQRLNPTLRKKLLKDYINAYAQAQGSGYRRQAQAMWFYFQRRKDTNPVNEIWLEGKKRPRDPPADEVDLNVNAEMDLARNAVAASAYYQRFLNDLAFAKYRVEATTVRNNNRVMEVKVVIWANSDPTAAALPNDDDDDDDDDDDPAAAPAGPSAAASSGSACPLGRAPEDAAAGAKRAVLPDVYTEETPSDLEGAVEDDDAEDITLLISVDSYPTWSWTCDITDRVADLKDFVSARVPMSTPENIVVKHNFKQILNDDKMIKELFLKDQDTLTITTGGLPGGAKEGAVRKPGKKDKKKAQKKKGSSSEPEAEEEGKPEPMEVEVTPRAKIASVATVERRYNDLAKATKFGEPVFQEILIMMTKCMDQVAVRNQPTLENMIKEAPLADMTDYKNAAARLHAGGNLPYLLDTSTKFLFRRALEVIEGGEKNLKNMKDLLVLTVEGAYTEKYGASLSQSFPTFATATVDGRVQKRSDDTEGRLKQTEQEKTLAEDRAKQAEDELAAMRARLAALEAPQQGGILGQAAALVGMGPRGPGPVDPRQPPPGR